MSAKQVLCAFHWVQDEMLRIACGHRNLEQLAELAERYLGGTISERIGTTKGKRFPGCVPRTATDGVSASTNLSLTI